jgi:hypothetical protein
MGCLRRLANCALFLIVLLVLAAAALYFYLLPRLDEELADALRREFMLPPSSTVTITRGTLLDTLEGEVQSCYIDSSEAKIAGLLVEEVRFVAEGVRFDLPRTLVSGQAELTAVTRGELTFRVSARAIEERWAGELRRMGLTDVQVMLVEDQVRISALADLMVAKVRVGATGRLTVDGTERIRFEATELELGEATIGVERFKAMFSALTPVIDLGSFKLAIVIDEVHMRDDYLHVAARSLSLGEKLATERERREQAEEEAQGEGRRGSRLRIPSLEELKDVFLEQEPEEQSTGEGEGDAGNGEQDGSAAAGGDQSPEDGQDEAEDEDEGASEVETGANAAG